MWDWCAGAASWYRVVVSARTRAGSTSESLAQETSAITTTESAETRIIDFFMAGTVVDAAGQFNRRTPRAVKRAGIADDIRLDRFPAIRNDSSAPQGAGKGIPWFGSSDCHALKVF